MAVSASLVRLAAATVALRRRSQKQRMLGDEIGDEEFGNNGIVVAGGVLHRVNEVAGQHQRQQASQTKPNLNDGFGDDRISDALLGDFTAFAFQLVALCPRWPDPRRLSCIASNLLRDSASASTSRFEPSATLFCSSAILQVLFRLAGLVFLGHLRQAVVTSASDDQAHQQARG